MSSNRFTVEKTTENNESKSKGTETAEETSVFFVPEVTINNEDGVRDESERYSYRNHPNFGPGQKAIFEREGDQAPFVSQVIHNLANARADSMAGDTDSQKAKHRKKFLCCKKSSAAKKKKKKKLGTLLGVYFPCIQNILGVILFIRMVWVVGTAGWLQSFILVSICCCCTLITAISMSAIATNGVVSSGGAYFMISRNLGPEFGGAVGILFYLGTTVASSMYIVGAVEILVQYMAPSLCFFGPVTEAANAYNSYRLYGSLLLITMVTCVFIGVKFVSKLSPIALLCVLGSILAIYIGIFVANPSRGPKVCFVGEFLIGSDKVRDPKTGEWYCSKEENGTLHRLFCDIPVNHITGLEDFDYCQYLNDSEVGLKPGIPGITSGVFFDNLWSAYSEKGQQVGTNRLGHRRKGDIVADITTSFVIMIGIFFPSVTGIMAGSNRSGDLNDAQKSIPTGTIAAVVTTSFIYLSCLLLFAATVEGQLLQDKFGESIGGGLVVAHLAWPNPWVIMVGSFFSTCGAGLQSLTGAPRLLQAIAEDNVIPILHVFSVTHKGEPLRALFLTALIAWSGVLLANVDYIAPVITMFFLMCYCFTNLACVLQTLLKTPNWRPRFKYYHWVLSLFGVFLCLALMFMTSWYYALVAIAIAFFVYKYIEYKGAEKEWGDGLTGLSMSAAHFALLRLEGNHDHAKNWRPQLLVLCKLDQETLEPMNKGLIDLASQLKEGKGLIIVSSVVKSTGSDSFQRADEAKSRLEELLKTTKAKGFVDVLVADDISHCLSYIVQGSGLGSLRHNAVLTAFPHNWRSDHNSCRMFFNGLRIMGEKDLAIMVAKGNSKFPSYGDPPLTGFIDAWWIVHDGGLLMLLPFLLMQHKVWKGCKMRIFTVAEVNDNSIQMKKDIEKFIYELRMKAEVQVIEMQSTDISAYTYERTLKMEQRNHMWKQIRSGSLAVNPQHIVDKNRKELPASSLAVLAEENNQEQFTFSPYNVNNFTKPKSQNVRRMHSAVNLNQLVREKSSSAQLIFLNLPTVPKQDEADSSFMEYLEVLTDGLSRVMLVKGSNKEVITIYS